MKSLIGYVFLFIFCCSLTASDFQGATHLVDLDHPNWDYFKGEPNDAIERIKQRIGRGDLRLPYDDHFGYVPALLRELNVSPSSQMLVFSKTSLQRERISPLNPRAIYFNDEVYVAFIPGAPLIEISTADPKMGGVFYTLEQKPMERPSFRRTDQCLECHASSKTMGVPGHLVRSFSTDQDGGVELSSGVSQVTHRTPFTDRWGGWYVTGTHGKQTHRGNLVGQDAEERQKSAPNFLGNRTNLTQFLQTSKYLEPGSDIVALMVLEHQTHMHNYITRLHHDAVVTFNTYGHVRYLESQVEGLLRYLLFVDEAPLEEQVKGTSKFQEEFEALGIKDSRGRSLRQLDLRSRMFKFPCSYLIYSEAFDGLPAPIQERIYQRLYEILTGADKTEVFAGLLHKERRAILEILQETKSGLPAYWQKN